MSEPLDIKGCPIRHGDLIRREHFRHYLHQQISYIHDVVTTKDGELWAVPFCVLAYPDMQEDRDGYSLAMLQRSSWRIEVIGSTPTEANNYTGFLDRKKTEPTKGATT